MTAPLESPKSLEELKRRCFKQHLDPSLKERYKRSWALYYPLIVTHAISIRLVWLLWRTPITPNQITWLSYIAGWSSCYFFLKNGLWVLVGAFLFEVFYILDAVDGQLARSRGTGSRGGAFLDDWANFLVPPVVLFSLGMRGDARWFPGWTAFFASFGVLSISLIELLKGRFSQKSSDLGAVRVDAQAKQSSLFKFLYSLLYRSCTMPVVMNLVTIASVLDAMSAPHLVAGTSHLTCLVYYFAATGLFLTLTKGIHTSKTL